ncbi:MAG TPA: PA0069 family radical SAM protein [Myxococcota bacterium]|nr:PA0069 family radical SAM protein [Myxococcota bacterium]
MARYREPLRGRGTQAAPPNRFESAAFVPDPDEGFDDELAPDPRTRFLRDASKSALARNDSPDVGFDVSINPYRGCEHGCVYCYARPTHEYLGFSSGLDFETRIVVKHELPELLRAALARPSWRPQVIGISGVTDAYQPVERRLRLTRRALEVLAEFRNPCAVITKSRLVARDADVFQELARHQAVSVSLSLTSLDPDLARKMEPRAAQPRARLAAVEALARAGIPVGVNLGPIVPGLTDHEIPALVAAAADAGARWAGWLLLRLPHAVKDLFAAWLADHFPDRREKVLHRIQAVRDGKLNATQFGVRHRGVGVLATQIGELVALARRRNGLDAHGPELSTAAFRRPGGGQLSLL